MANAWWRSAVIYQVYPRSYCDKDGNGIGDIPGLISKLDYIAALGVDVIWLSPVYPSPMEDFGYDVTDHCNVDPMFGTLNDARDLIGAAHDLGLKIIVDLVLSHTSNQHPWFQESRRDRFNVKANWYVWADAADDGSPPNNWLSLFGGSAWEWEPVRKQYYLHNFLVSQPDMNFHNPEVQEAALNVVKFWLELGVDGFRLDTVNFFFHDAELRSNPPISKDIEIRSVPSDYPYAMQSHLYDKSRPETLIFLERFRKLLDGYGEKLTVGELSTDEAVADQMRAYSESNKRLSMVYGFDLFCETPTAGELGKIIEERQRNIGDGWTCNSLSNHDVKRVVSRWGFEDQAKDAGVMLTAFVCTLQGTPCLFQGDELGLEESSIAFEDLQDPFGKRFWPEFKGRDGCRTPMPWTSQGEFAGFSSVKPWLPVSVSHFVKAVDVQEADPRSTLGRVRAFLAWRKANRSYFVGTFELLNLPEPALGIVRASGSETLLAVFNFGKQPLTLDISKYGTARLIRGCGFDDAEIDGAKLFLGAASAAFAQLD
ncbi:alpha-glucosidase [Nitrincola sp. MINF-07-Sa-05]|uniref:alpha-glucosidase n=1 Tax=Nitrincola salilacus TaxID=3400273 RepID=UPI003917ECED